MEFWKQLWRDVRSVLLQIIIMAIITGSAVTSFYTWIRAQADNPVTTMGSAVFFLISLIVAAVGFAFYLVRKRRSAQTGGQVIDDKAFTYKWIIAVLGIVAISLIGWNLLLQRSVRHLEDQMARYVLPRNLTQEQKDTIANYLAKFEPQAVVMKIIPRNEEASSYRADLQQALEKGGWPIANFIYDETVQEGLSIQTMGPSPGQQTPFDRLNPKKTPTQILLGAFTQAGVVIHGGGSGSGRDITTTTITISIGNRRRDKWAIPPPPPQPQPDY